MPAGGDDDGSRLEITPNLSPTFAVFFLALVILINARDQVIQMQENPTEDIAETLVQFPCALEADDIEDFCSLAQYYVSRTPQSYRYVYPGERHCVCFF